MSKFPDNESMNQKQGCLPGWLVQYTLYMNNLHMGAIFGLILGGLLGELAGVR